MDSQIACSASYPIITNNCLVTNFQLINSYAHKLSLLDDETTFPSCGNQACRRLSSPHFSLLVHLIIFNHEILFLHNCRKHVAYLLEHHEIFLPSILLKPKQTKAKMFFYVELTPKNNLLNYSRWYLNLYGSRFNSRCRHEDVVGRSSHF